MIVGVTIRGIGFWGGGFDFVVGVDQEQRLVDPFLSRAMPRFNALVTACRAKNLIVEECTFGGSGRRRPGPVAMRKRLGDQK